MATATPDMWLSNLPRLCVYQFILLGNRGTCVRVNNLARIAPKSAVAANPTRATLDGKSSAINIVQPSLVWSFYLATKELRLIDVHSFWQGFDQPHDLAVSPDCEAVFVGEVSPDVVWKFVKEQEWPQSLHHQPLQLYHTKWFRLQSYLNHDICDWQ